METALIRAGVYAMGWDYSIKLRYGQATTAQPRHLRPGALGGYFRTRDDRWFCMASRSPRDFPAVMQALGRPEYISNPRYALPILDQEVVLEVRDMLDATFAALTLEEVAVRLKQADVIWAPMATIDEVVEDETAEHAGCFVETPDGWGGAFRAPAAPVRFPGADTSPSRAAPKLGEHTRDVLREAGLSDAEIDLAVGPAAA